MFSTTLNKKQEPDYQIPVFIFTLFSKYLSNKLSCLNATFGFYSYNKYVFSCRYWRFEFLTINAVVLIN